MKYTLLILGIIALALSFIIKQYFLQFLVLSAIFICFFLVERNKVEIGELKKLMNEHNDLIKKDLEELKKSE